MNFKSLFAAALAVVATFSGNAYAGPTWTVTTSGTVTSGIDTTGVFGVAGRDLTGLSFKQAITSSTEWQTAHTFTELGYAIRTTSGPSTTDTVTVGGVTVSFVTSPDQYAQQSLYNQFAYAGAGILLNEIQSVVDGTTTTAGVNLVAVNYAYSFGAAFFSGLSLNQSLSVVDPSIRKLSSFQVDGSQDAYFSAVADSFDVTFDEGTSVPEPASLALLGLGLAGVAVARRCKAN